MPQDGVERVFYINVNMLAIPLPSIPLFTTYIVENLASTVYLPRLNLHWFGNKCSKFSHIFVKRMSPTLSDDFFVKSSIQKDLYKYCSSKNFKPFLSITSCAQFNVAEKILVKYPTTCQDWLTTDSLMSSLRVLFDPGDLSNSFLFFFNFGRRDSDN